MRIKGIMCIWYYLPFFFLVPTLANVKLIQTGFHLALSNGSTAKAAIMANGFSHFMVAERTKKVSGRFSMMSCTLMHSRMTLKSGLLGLLSGA